MNVRRSLLGLTFCTCYLASHLTNKYVLSVLKFTYPTLFQGWQTFIGGLLLHMSWKLGWVELHSSPSALSDSARMADHQAPRILLSPQCWDYRCALPHPDSPWVLGILLRSPSLHIRSDVLIWLPASALFVGIIYAGSKALSRLAVPVFFILHNVAEVLTCGYQKCVWKEKTSLSKICSALFLLAAAGCLPFQDSQFDPDGYFWALIHIFCVGSYKILRKSRKPTVLSDIDQQYLNYIFSMVLLAFASHPTGDLFGALDFPFLYFYRFHGSCCASGVLGFFLMLSTVRLRSILAPGQCAAWILCAKASLEQAVDSDLAADPHSFGERKMLEPCCSGCPLLSPGCHDCF
ncbi:transmembrane protein 241 isoform X6 [Mus musculus]|uniref:transmembrane protein 241 isoform X6 n=1 Tax=Mus musculus TaxID=10090 RepID=UPI0003D77EBD|nr:transmembrane protein 241 isoform X6 [Mus musculus]|eukprot:XP_006526117.1 PREDICTED: transmembrane protein 241 isoform X4 [Mus musculus]